MLSDSAWLLNWLWQLPPTSSGAIVCGAILWLAAFLQLPVEQHLESMRRGDSSASDMLTLASVNAHVIKQSVVVVFDARQV